LDRPADSLAVGFGRKIVWDKEAAKAGQPAARTVQPGDIALLFRALTDVEYYEAALRRYGIDYYLVGGHAFYAQQEVFDLLNLLRALESSCDQTSLLGVLRSPFSTCWMKPYSGWPDIPADFLPV